MQDMGGEPLDTGRGTPEGRYRKQHARHRQGSQDDEWEGDEEGRTQKKGQTPEVIVRKPQNRKGRKEMAHARGQRMKDISWISSVFSGSWLVASGVLLMESRVNLADNLSQFIFRNFWKFLDQLTAKTSKSSAPNFAGTVLLPEAWQLRAQPEPPPPFLVQFNTLKIL